MNLETIMKLEYFTFISLLLLPITLWKPRELDKNGIRAESRLDLSGDIVKEWSLLFCGRDQQLVLRDS